MALYSGAVKELIAPGANDPKITAVGVILHTDAGNVTDLHDYFDGPSGGIESHFHIPKVKSVKQYRDTAYEADANLHANSFLKDGKLLGFISVETQGLATEPWNDYQLSEIKKLILWAKSVHPLIQLRVCPGPYDPGIGYHTLFGSPGPWTPVAKSCPGPLRIKQFNDVLVPWFAHATAPKEEDMPLTEAEWTRLGKLVYAKNSEYAVDFWVEETGTGTALRRDVAAIKAAIDPGALADAIIAKLPAGAVDQATVEAGVRAVLKEGTD